MGRMTPRRWAIVVFCSIALNVVLAGVIVAAYVNRDRDIALRMSVYTVPWAFRVIGEEVGTQARRIYLKYQAAMGAQRQSLMQDYHAVSSALSAPQFDGKKFNEALGRMRADTATAQATMHDAMTEFAAELTPEQRRQLAMTVNEWAEKREQRALRREQAIEQRERRDNSK